VAKHDEVSAHPPWESGKDTFIPTCRCTGKRLSGKYKWGSTHPDQYLQFFPDGTFVDFRITDQLLAISFDRPRIQRSAYSIQSQTMIFHFADGHRGMRTCHGTKGATGRSDV
jgi:hypothetical protein